MVRLTVLLPLTAWRATRMLRNATTGNLASDILKKGNEKEATSKVETKTTTAEVPKNQTNKEPNAQRETESVDRMVVNSIRNIGKEDGNMMTGALESINTFQNPLGTGDSNNLKEGYTGEGREDNFKIELEVEEAEKGDKTTPQDDPEIDLDKKKETNKGNKRVNFMEAERENEMGTKADGNGQSAKRVVGEELDEISKELLCLAKVFETAKMRILANEKSQVENISKLATFVMEYRKRNMDDLRTKDTEVANLKSKIFNMTNVSEKQKANLSAEVDQLKRAIADLKRESGVNRKGMDEKERVILELDNQVKALQEMERNLSTELDFERKAKSQALSDVEMTNHQLHQRELDLAALRVELTNLQEELRMTKMKDVERWKSKVDHLNRVISELDVSKKEVEERDMTIKMFKEELKVATDDFKEANGGMEALSVKVKKIEIECRDLETQLKEVSDQLKESKQNEEKQKSKEEGLVKVIGIAEDMVRDKEMKIRSMSEELATSRQKEQTLNDRLGEVDHQVYSLTKADNEHKEVEEQLRAEVGEAKKKLKEARASQVS